LRSRHGDIGRAAANGFLEALLPLEPHGRFNGIKVDTDSADTENI
jgi:hypothetical protein